MAIILKERATALTAVVEPSDGKYVILCPELDLATEGNTPEAAFEELVEMVIDYSEQYMDEYERFSQSPNRAIHAPFIQVIHDMKSKENVRALFT